LALSVEVRWLSTLDVDAVVESENDASAPLNENEPLLERRPAELLTDGDRRIFLKPEYMSLALSLILAASQVGTAF
jgi:hypothetical protein